MSPIILGQELDYVWPSRSEFVVDFPTRCYKVVSALAGGVQVVKCQNIAEHVGVEGLHIVSNFRVLVERYGVLTCAAFEYIGLRFSAVPGTSTLVMCTIRNINVSLLGS